MSWHNNAVKLSMLLCLGFLQACSPEFDWRTSQSDEGAYQVTFPAKPSSDSRNIRLANQSVPMTMQAARAGEALFVVGVVILPADAGLQRAQMLEDMRRGLHANLPGGRVEEKQVVARSAGDPPDSIVATEMQITGVPAVEQMPRRMTVRLLVRQERIYQVMVLESGKSATDSSLKEQVEQFLQSFHPY